MKPHSNRFPSGRSLGPVRLGVFALAAFAVASATTAPADDVSLDGTTLDLAGADLTVGALSSANAASEIVNSGAPATLTIGDGGADSTFVGRIGPGIRLVKTGSGTIDLSTSAIEADTVAVEGGTLCVAQAATTRARHFRFTFLEQDPWHTQNKNSMGQMGYFGLVLGTADVAWPSGATATDNSGASIPQVLVHGENAESGDWQASQYAGASFVVDAGEEIEFDGYRIAGATISTGRNPYRFTVDVGVEEDGAIVWHRFDEQKTFVAAEYGRDRAADGTDGAWCYAPRMLPIHAPNPLPVFRSDAAVSVASGATLALRGVSGALPSLSGEGTVRLEGARPRLTGDCSFTGLFDGRGVVIFAMDGATVPAFRFASLAFRVANEGAARTWALAGAEGAPAILPDAEDTAEAPLSLALSGPVVRRKAPARVDRFGRALGASALHGFVAYDGASISYADAPALARFVRFRPLSGRDTNVGITGELDLRLGGVSATPALAYSYLDPFATTNWTSGILDDQNAYIENIRRSTAKLFDGDADSYDQRNDLTGDEGATAPAVCTLSSITAFDSVVPSAPSTSAMGNGALLTREWSLEASLDGSDWERVIPYCDLTDALGPWGSTAYNRGELGDWPISGAAGGATVPAASQRVAGGTMAVSNALVNVRMIVTELSGEGGTGVGSFLSFGELQLHSGENWVLWPAGTTAAWTWADGTLGPADGSAASVADSTGAFTTNVWDNYAANQALDGPDEAQWSVGSAEKLAAGAGFAITTGAPVDFDSYAIYMGGQWRPNNRCPTAWTLEVSYDGESWAVADAASGYAWNTLSAGWSYMRDHWYCTRGADLSGLDALAGRDDFADDATLVVDAGATFAVSSVRETVGALDGTGDVVLSGRSPVLTIAGDDDEARFSGRISGDGTLVIAGGTAKLRGANLRGLSRIVVQSGATLAGTAEFESGAPEIVVEEGGACTLRAAGMGFVMCFR